jgi:hypothetical protein
MPACRFWALYEAIPALEATELYEQAVAAAFAANPGERGEALNRYLASLDARRGKQTEDKSGMSTLALAGLPGATLVEKGVIDARLAQGIAAVKEQERAWQTDGMAGLLAVIARQRHSQ